MTSFELLSCFLLLALSAFLASSEIALFSLSRFQLRALKESFRPGYWKIKKLLGDPGGLLITILVLNEVVNISLTAIITGAISRLRSGADWLGAPGWVLDTLLGIVVAAPLVLFFGEVTPKVFAARANQLVSSVAVGPLLVIYDLFKPARVLLRRLVHMVSKIGGDHALDPSSPTEAREQGEGKAGEDRILHESDFLLMLEEGHKEGAIHQSELELIKNVFEFDDTTVASICTPLHQVHTLLVSTPVRIAVQAIRGQPFSRLPVISTDRKTVLGILHTKDLLRAKLQQEDAGTTIERLVRKPLVVQASLRLNSLFRKFKQQRIHMAIVQNPAGAAIGVVTMSDVLDSLFQDLLPDEDAS